MSADLIARLEAAAGPCRDLDRAIGAHLGWTMTHWGDGTPRAWRSPGGDITTGLPEWTYSIDAALTLVPDDANCHGYEAEPTLVTAYVSRNKVRTGHWLHQGEHASSPAIALCIAALKARA